MRLYLINPHNTTQHAIYKSKKRLFSYFIFKPLSLLVLAGLTPSEWDIVVIDENLKLVDYTSMPRPDLVGITAFTSQAPRAYEIAAAFKSRGIPVVMGGIHTSMCIEEAMEHADSVVTGEAETVWADVLTDAKRGTLKRIYKGTPAEMDKSPLARHDLLPNGYRMGSIQTTRGCPLDCSYCSVTAFNGRRYRKRPIEDVIEELKLIREKFVIIVDDNLIGTRKEHLARAKDLFRAIIKADLNKKWMTQVTINIADDEELLRLAAESGCFGVFIGVESISEDGLVEIKKKFNINKTDGMKESIKRLHRHRILVAGSFIMGLDVDTKGIGQRIAETGRLWGLDVIALQFLTPLPGTRLWETMKSEGRIITNHFPEDWKYYNLTYPVAHYKNFSWPEIRQEMNTCYKDFYSSMRILRRGINILFSTKKIGRVLILFLTSMGFRLDLKQERNRIPEIKIENVV